LQRLLSEAGFEDVAVYARGNGVTVACYKALSLIFPLLFPQRRTLLVRACFLPLALLLLPFAAMLAAAGQLSMRGRGGDDCLGYTVVAKRSPGGISPC
jgi:hypothetical protein